MLTRIIACFALVAGVLSSLIAPGLAAAQADTRDGTYTDPVYFFGFSWDPDLYEATELLDEDDVPYGVVLENDLEYGSMAAAGYSSPRSCLNERSDLFEEIEGVSDFEEVDDLDWPETDPDARAALYRYEYENPDTGDTGTFIQYFECRDLLIEGEPVDDVVLTFDMGVEEDSYEDSLPAWEDILSSLEWDVDSGSNSNRDPDDNGSSAEGVDGNVYIDPTYFWTIEWDDDVLTGENWILDEDEGTIGVQLYGDSGSFLTIFTREASSARTCLNGQLDFAEGSAFTDFEEVDDIELPEASDDARDALYRGVFTSSSGDEAPIYFYASCQPLIVDGEEVEDTFLVVNLLVFLDSWEDELELWSDVLRTLAFDALVESNNDDDDEDRDTDEEDDADEDDTDTGETGIVGDLFVSALGFQISWDDAIYTGELLDEDNPDRGVVITSEGSYITVQVVGDPDAEACVEAEVEVLEGLEGMGRLSESDKEGPEPARGSAGGLFEATYESTSGGETDITVYVECRPLVETGDTPLFVVVSMIGFGTGFEDEVSAWQDILDSLEIPG